jgi:hypothetical protein
MRLLHYIGIQKRWLQWLVVGSSLTALNLDRRGEIREQFSLKPEFHVN